MDTCYITAWWITTCRFADIRVSMDSVGDQLNEARDIDQEQSFITVVACGITATSSNSGDSTVWIGGHLFVYG